MVLSLPLSSLSLSFSLSSSSIYLSTVSHVYCTPLAELLALIDLAELLAFSWLLACSSRQTARGGEDNARGCQFTDDDMCSVNGL